MIYNFEINAETPAKKNSRITLRNGMTIPSKRYREWHALAEKEIKTQKLPIEPLDSPARVLLRFAHGDLRRRDSDNGTSSIMDLLVDVGILADDNWQIVRQIRIQNDYIKGEPKCEIVITEYEE